MEYKVLIFRHFLTRNSQDPTGVEKREYLATQLVDLFSLFVIAIRDQKRSHPNCKFILVTFFLVDFFSFDPCFNFIYRRSIDFEEYLHQGKHYIKTLRTKCTCMSGSSTPQFIPRIYITFCWPMALYTHMHD